MPGSDPDKPAIPAALLSFNPDPDAFGPDIDVVRAGGFCRRESLDDLDTLRGLVCLYRIDTISSFIQPIDFTISTKPWPIIIL